MKTRLLFLISTTIVLLSNTTGFAQSPAYSWVKQAGGNSGSSPSSISTDASGNIIAVGTFYGRSLIFGNDTLMNADTTGATDDIFAVKYDPSGNPLWARRAGGVQDDHGKRGYADASGNVYVTGNFFDSIIVFETDTVIVPGIHTFTLGANANPFIVKYDPMGNVLWAKANTGFSIATSSAVSTDAAGNVYVAGWFLGSIGVTFESTHLTSTGGWDPFLLKYDASGNLLWVKNTGGAYNAKVFDMAVDPSGNSYITGYFDTPTIAFDAITLTNTDPHTQDIYIVKYDPSGNVIWAKNQGGTLSDEAFSIVIDAAGNSFISGCTNALLGPVIGTPYACKGFVSKYDPSGNPLWTKVTGGTGDSYADDVTIDQNGNILASGEFLGITGWGPYTLTNAAPTGSDIFIAKFDSTGNELWATSSGGTAYDAGSAITTDNNNNIIIGGYFESPTISFGATNLTYTGSTLFVAKMDNVRSVVWPGDADYNFTVSNNDLLPIGLYYGQTGAIRTVTGNAWQADTCSDWGMLETNGVDIKNADCNGDGLIDANDTLAVNINFTSVHSIMSHPININSTRSPLPDLHFVTSSSAYPAGSTIDVEVWAGTSSVPVTDLYGLAFDINYETSFVQSGTESISYPVNWLGTTGTNAISIAKVDPLAATAYGAETRTDHTNASGFGKISDFKFQLKNAIPANSVMHFSVSGYKSNDATGTGVFFNTQPDSILINSTAGINELTNSAGISVFPNPATGIFNLVVSAPTKNTIVEVYNSTGILVYRKTITNELNSIDLTAQPNGLYFVKVMTDSKIIASQKMIRQ